MLGKTRVCVSQEVSTGSTEPSPWVSKEGNYKYPGVINPQHLASCPLVSSELWTSSTLQNSTRYWCPHNLSPPWLKRRRKDGQGFPGGSVVKNPPANAGDTGSIPDPGRSHEPWSICARVHPNYWACALGPGAPTTEHTCCSCWRPHALKPVLPNKKSHCNESHTATREQGLLATTREEAWAAQRPSPAKNKFFFFKKEGTLE